MSRPASIAPARTGLYPVFAALGFVLLACSSSSSREPPTAVPVENLARSEDSATNGKGAGAQADPEVTGEERLTGLDGPYAELRAYCDEAKEDEALEPPDCDRFETKPLDAAKLPAGLLEARWFGLENTAMGEQTVFGLRTSTGWYFRMVTNGVTHEWATIDVDGIRALPVGPTLVLSVRLNYDHRAINTYWTGKVLCALQGSVPYCSRRLTHDYESHDHTDEDGEVTSDNASRTLSITDSGLVVVGPGSGDAEREDAELLGIGAYRLVFAKPNDDDDN